MQASAAAIEKTSDLGTATIATMRQLGLACLPRNYEIFYEALTGLNHELSLAVVSLPKRPTQQEVDAIGSRFFSFQNGQNIVESARTVVANELEQVAALLRDERTYLEKYGQILTQTTGNLEGRTPSAELMRKILQAMTTATNATIEHGRQTAMTLGDKSAELESVKQKLEEYKKLVDTDALTLIANRRAFDREITKIYDTQSGIMFKSLILMDIDSFKSINDRFGHPIGDRIIQIIAGVLRSNTRSDVFVARTGGEEFAAIVEGGSEDVTFEIAERIRMAVQQTSFAAQIGTDHGAITLSVGLCMAAEADGPEDLYSKSDRALYRSKVAGRNRTTRHSSMVETGQKSKGWMLYKKD